MIARKTTVQPTAIPAAAPVLNPEDDEVDVGAGIEVGDGVDSTAEVDVLKDPVDTLGMSGHWHLCL